MTTDYLSQSKCPECGAPEFVWYFTAPDGERISAKLGVLPDLGGLEAAKSRAVAEHEKDKETRGW